MPARPAASYAVLILSIESVKKDQNLSVAFNPNNQPLLNQAPALIYFPMHNKITNLMGLVLLIKEEYLHNVGDGLIQNAVG